MHLQSRTAGDIAGPSGGQGSSAHPEKPLIKEDNALATLQAAFPKEVKYKTVKGPHNSRSARRHAFCTTSHGLTGKLDDSMMSHHTSHPIIVTLSRSCCIGAIKKHSCSMNSIFRLCSLGRHSGTLQVCSDYCQVPKRANDCDVQCSGKFCEEIDVMGGFHVARGTTTTRQAAKRWAAMRLLHQLKHAILPAFYSDTPEGWFDIRRLITS